jgi:hypothetical protein
MRLAPIDRALPSVATGIYPKTGTGHGQYGSTAYPGLLEAYNRDSDYKRWRAGQQLYAGSGWGWGSTQIHSLARFVNGAVDGTSKEITTLFPSKTSPEGAWYTTCRTRGSIIAPQPLQANAITLNTNPENPAEHTLVWNVSGVLTPGQVAVFGTFIGDQFEDSATGPQYPGDLAPLDAGSIALTLTAASPQEMTLTFDLSRPFGRAEHGGKIYWQALPYSPQSPRQWRPGRYLCSSFKFFCCCPDHLQGVLANTERPSQGFRRDLFPMPSAGRSARAPWEQQGAGFYRQWRSLPDRRDRRRDCKHIHALRWECGVPWLEPDDYPTADARDFLEYASRQERAHDPEEILEFFQSRRLSWDRFALAVADAVGIILFPDGDPRESIRPDPRPLLWNDRETPEVAWCRQNDWWVQRGTQNLRIFNGTMGRFESDVTISGVQYPILSLVAPGSPGAPVIVR